MYINFFWSLGQLSRHKKGVNEATLLLTNNKKVGSDFANFVSFAPTFKTFLSSNRVTYCIKVRYFREDLKQVGAILLTNQHIYTMADTSIHRHFVFCTFLGS